MRRKIHRVIVAASIDSTVNAQLDLLSDALGLSKCALIREIIEREIPRLLHSREAA